MKAFCLALLALCALACAMAALPGNRAAAAVRPTPTPTPVALAYDEITRMVAPPNTPPPPGSFAADYALALQAPNGDQGASTPTPAPRKHGLGGMLNSVMNPMSNAGANPGEGGPGGPPGMGSGAMMHQLQYGHVVRLTYYWSRSWVREDDPVAQIATITKCPQHQVIHLNLAAKTYTIEDTSQSGCVHGDTASDGQRGYRMGPGTADADVSSTARSLGPKTLEDVATTGTDDTLSMSMTNATGSCRDNSMSMERIAYISSIHKPRAYCPLASAPGGSGGGGFMGSGCKPTFHGNGAGAFGGGDLLEMYVLLKFGSAQGMGQLTERGHVKWLYKPEADPLFEPPKDFTNAGG